ncbi:tetratricopeptide repeat protein [Tolypothrix sp. PCC 7910]|uniref:tetratricopeptide repeat protein n=1 Tax=Tolypothrix sp. PCC 7910 TaxID=2099387 RepID=UPI00142776E8|nr:tetratricopeptide repeat protein [Tolypothrix sp. PCC 7910]QIR36611.1 tetratricopeptide repeat protein [Tolypothrix sp. PCC 7910]
MSEHRSPEEILQSILRNVQVGGNLTTGDITQILNLLVIIQQPEIFKPKETPQNIPRANVVKFVGHDETLVSLHQRLQNNNQVVVAAIEGMAGVGKTELATQYALIHLLLNNYPGGICWLRARDEDIGLQILQFAIAKLGLKPPEDWDVQKQVDFCWSRWHDGNVLVVLDDVTDYAKVEPYLPPQSPRFKLLITTRLQLDFPQSFTLDVLSESAALELLQEWVGREKVAQELVDAKAICQLLGYLPLALNLVGRYVKKRKISLTEMLRRLEAKKLAHESLARDEKDKTWTLNVTWGVAAAFELSWDELSHNARELAILLSLFALAPIPWTLVKSVETGKDAEQLEDSRVELESLHLLQDKDGYQLHQLIREFFQLKQAEFNQIEEFKESFYELMIEIAKDIPQKQTLEQVNAVSPMIPHLAEVANYFIQYFSNEDFMAVFIGITCFYEYQGLYNQAIPWSKQCLEATKECLGEENPYVLTSLSNLAKLYRLQGRYNEAEPLYLQVLALSRQLQGEEHLDVASSLNNLALLYDSQGRYSEAESLLMQALAICRQIGGEHTDVAPILNSLAKLYISQDRYNEAESLLMEAVALWRKLLGEEHPYFATSLNNLGLLYSSQGRYSEAEPLYIKALAICRQLLGEEHPYFATSLNNLGLLYSSQGRYSEAEPLYIKALAILRKLLGEEHPDVATCLSNLAGLYKSQDRYIEAESAYIKALEIYRQLLGEENPNFATCLSNLAEVYRSVARFSKAEPLYIQALDIFERQLGVNHPTTVACRDSLAHLRELSNLEQQLLSDNGEEYLAYLLDILNSDQESQ